MLQLEIRTPCDMIWTW